MRTEKISYQNDFFDHIEREQLLAGFKRPLDRMNEVIDWEDFRAVLENKLAYRTGPKGGRPAKDPVLMLKICILQFYHGLSDEETEFQILDRTSFRRFLGLGVGNKVPDARTLWLFKENLGAEGVEELFALFHGKLNQCGLIGKVGKIIDATIISAPVQRNSKSENAAIKEGKRPKSFDENAAKARQKDSDARWTKKHNKSYYGYKNHAKVDLSSKLIEAYCTSAASLHDSQAAVELIEEGDGTMFADSAYVGERIANDLKKKGVHSLIHEKGTKNWPLNERQKKLNKGKSRLRARVEHVFGWQAQSAMDRVRTIGAKRARRNIGFFNLFYNFFRTEQLLRPSVT